MKLGTSKGVLNITLISLIIFTILGKESVVGFENKYAEEVNLNVLNLKEPLRMAKLNLFWEKARKRLSEPKLRKLLSELKVQDQEELTLKKLKASGGDKEGLKEAELTRRLKQIIQNYALENQMDETQYISSHKQEKIDKATFKDKKLHKLWLKAEKSGMTQEELKILKEEFQHHQNKIDEYYALIEKASNSPNDLTNFTNEVNLLDAVDGMDMSSQDYNENFNTIRETHRSIKNGYNELHRKATSGPESKEFSEPKAASLWKLALRSDFDNVELESLHTELKHYEARLHKFNYLSKELDKVGLAKVDDEISDEDKEKILSAKQTEGRRILEERLDKQRRKTKKLHEDLELRILARHSEL